MSIVFSRCKFYLCSGGVFSFVKVNRLICFCRTTGEKDVTLKVLYCGICHSDLHSVKNEWGNAKYPLVPGQVKLYKHLNSNLALNLNLSFWLINGCAATSAFS